MIYIYTISSSHFALSSSKAMTISWRGPNRPLTVASHLRWMSMRRFCFTEPLGTMQTPSSAKGLTTEPANMPCMVPEFISRVRLAKAISIPANSTSGAADAGVRER